MVSGFPRMKVEGMGAWDNFGVGGSFLVFVKEQDSSDGSPQSAHREGRGRPRYTLLLPNCTLPHSAYNMCLLAWLQPCLLEAPWRDVFVTHGRRLDYCLDGPRLSCRADSVQHGRRRESISRPCSAECSPAVAISASFAAGLVVGRLR